MITLEEKCILIKILCIDKICYILIYYYSLYMLKKSLTEILTMFKKAKINHNIYNNNNYNKATYTEFQNYCIL